MGDQATRLKQQNGLSSNSGRWFKRRPTVQNQVAVRHILRGPTIQRQSDEEKCTRLSLDWERDIKNGEYVIVRRFDNKEQLAEFSTEKGAVGHMKNIPAEEKIRYVCLPTSYRKHSFAIYKHKDYTEEWRQDKNKDKADQDAKE